MTDFDTTRANETATTAVTGRDRSGGSSGGSTGAGASAGDFASDARFEASGMLRDGMAHPSTRPVLTGAAIGAVAGVLLPFVSLPLGAAAGAGYAFYRRLRPANR